MKKYIVGLVAVFIAVGSYAGALNTIGLSVPEMARLQGTDLIRVKSSDFTVTATNTTEVFSNAIPAGCVVNLSSMHLRTAFDVGTTNFTGSCLVTVGTAGTADLLMASTELASDGTEIFNKIGLEANTLYTSVATNIIITFTPNLLETGGLAANTSGDVEFVFQVLRR